MKPESRLHRGLRYRWGVRLTELEHAQTDMLAFDIDAPVCRILAVARRHFILHSSHGTVHSRVRVVYIPVQ